MPENIYITFHKDPKLLKMKASEPYPISQYLPWCFILPVSFLRALKWVCPRIWQRARTHTHNPLLTETINSTLINFLLILTCASSHPGFIYTKASYHTALI